MFWGSKFEHNQDGVAWSWYTAFAKVPSRIVWVNVMS